MKSILLVCAWLVTSGLLAQSPCSPLSLPDLPPWPIANPLEPWHVDTTYGDQPVAARAYLKYRCNPVGDSLRKPFVFVEGIDFNLETEPLRCGDFGWEAFIGGSPNYTMLYNMPTLVNALRDEGYDIILVDFEDGAADLRANAAVLQTILQRLQQHTAAGEPLVLAGASMGGQITRYTLASMEAAGIPHCCRLWISLDAPHTGANIPLGLQHCLDFLAEPVLNLSNAQNKRAETLARPAARQLLRDQLPSVTSLHESFFSEMNALGYPQDMRTIAVANGAMDATPVALTPGSSLFDYEVTFPLTEETTVHLQAFATPGNGGYLFDGTAPISFVPVYSADPCSWVPEAIIEDSQAMPAGALALDHAPGGKRNTISELVLEVNAGLSSSGCDTDTIEDAQMVHSFIPTASALGVDDAYLFLPLGQALAANPNLSPFDVTHGPMGTNEWHSEVSDATAALLLREVLASENPLPEVLDDALFTFRDSASYLVYDVEVTGNGKLHVHAGGPPHWGVSPSGTTTPLGGHFELLTNPCGAELVVHDGGELLLGQASSQSTTTLRLRTGSSLTLGEGGLLQLDAGSTLWVEDGATLHLAGGQCRVAPGAEIHIAPGGTLNMTGGDLQLEGPEGGLFIGGDWLLNTATTFAPSFLEELAPIHITHDVELQTDTETGLLLEGAHPENVALYLLPGVTLKLPSELTHFRMQDAQVTLEQDAQLDVRCHAHHRNSTITCPNADCAGLALHHDAYIQDSQWHELPADVLLNNGLLRMRDCTVSGESGHVFVKGRTYDIEGTEFLASQGLYSEALEFDARLRACTFEDTGVVGNAEAVGDHSDRALFVQGCAFTGGNVGLAKEDGALHLQCSSFSSNETAVLLSGNIESFFDPLHGGGYNHFHHNTTVVHVDGAPLPVLQDGYNRWEQETNGLLIEGWTPGSCEGACQVQLSATHNTWSEVWEDTEAGVSGPEPLPEKFDVWQTDPLYGCAGMASELGCALTWGDQAPAAATACLNWVPKPGLNRALQLDAIRVAPNPSAGPSVLLNGSAEVVWITGIASATGQLHSDFQARCEPGAQIALPKLEPGSYFLRLSVEGKPAVVPWIVVP